MRIEPGTPVLGLRVVDPDGRRLGRLAAAYCTPDPLTAVWLVVRLPGVPRRWRAVPARDAVWHDPAQTTVRVAYPRPRVLASPPVDEDRMDTAAGRAPAERFYAIPPAYATC